MAKVEVKKSSSECDTEDEIEKIRQLQQSESNKGDMNGKPSVVNGGNDDDVYNISTDEEGDNDGSITADNANNISNTNNEDKRKFFKDKTFFFYGDFDSKDSNLLKRHIATYGGTVSDYMRETVDLVITEACWDSNFEQALKDNSALVFLQPKWIFKCHEKQCVVPYDGCQIAQKSSHS